MVSNPAKKANRRLSAISSGSETVVGLPGLQERDEIGLCGAPASFDQIGHVCPQPDHRGVRQRPVFLGHEHAERPPEVDRSTAHLVPIARRDADEVARDGQRDGVAEVAYEIEVAAVEGAVEQLVDDRFDPRTEIGHRLRREGRAHEAA